MNYSPFKNGCPWIILREKRRKDKNPEDDTVHIWFEEVYYCKATGMQCNIDNCAPFYLFQNLQEN